MSIILTVLLLGLTVLVSWYNAKVCGSYWAEAKALGGFPRVLMWCGAIQSAIGFSMLILLVELGIGLATGYIPAKAASAAMSLWYLAVIVPCIGTGLIITIQSWITAYRERSWANAGIAAYNTFATGMNIYDAANGGVSEAISKVSDLFGDDDNPLGKVVLLLVVIAIAGGAVVTSWLIGRYDRQARIAIAQERQASA